MRQFIYIKNPPARPAISLRLKIVKRSILPNPIISCDKRKVLSNKILCVNVLKFCSIELSNCSASESAVTTELMKNKLGVDFAESGKFVGDLPMTDLAQQRTPKSEMRRESVTPKIVVCPPMEEVPEPVSAPRGARLLKALSKRLSRRANDADSLGSSSSNDSMSCETGRTDDRSSCSASDSGSDGSDHRRRHRSTVSLRRVFQNLNLTSRSQSSSPTERQRQPKKQQQPKRILRPPITYTYVRGLSGLPTQRVPRHTVCCATMGLNR